MTDKKPNEQKEAMPKKERKPFFKDWWNSDLKFSIFFTILAIIIGVISFKINRTLINLPLMLIVFIASALIVKKKWNLKEEKGWWFSKFIVYLFIWFVVWTAFHTSCQIYNMFC
jgi:hypothetical protein